MSSRIAAVIGWPINHSLSPYLHRYWLEEYGIDGDYEPIALEPEQLERFFGQIRRGEFLGCNVTLPHKEGVAKFVDEVDQTATAIGAVNTVWRAGDRLLASNTDAYGFSANLDEKAPDWRSGQTAIVLGAGGSARAILFALKKVGYRSVYVVNRTLARAETLCEDFGPEYLPKQWNALTDIAETADLLVNTTSLSMNTETPFPIEIEKLVKTAIVSDIVYTPLKTSLLSVAAKHGLHTVDGLGMLLHQAVPGFEKWFGVRPVVSEGLRTQLLNQLGARSP